MSADVGEQNARTHDGGARSAKRPHARTLADGTRDARTLASRTPRWPRARPLLARPRPALLLPSPCRPTSRVPPAAVPNDLRPGAGASARARAPKGGSGTADAAPCRNADRRIWTSARRKDGSPRERAGSRRGGGGAALAPSAAAAPRRRPQRPRRPRRHERRATGIRPGRVGSSRGAALDHLWASARRSHQAENLPNPRRSPTTSSEARSYAPLVERRPAGTWVGDWAFDEGVPVACKGVRIGDGRHVETGDERRAQHGVEMCKQAERK